MIAFFIASLTLTTSLFITLFIEGSDVLYSTNKELLKSLIISFILVFSFSLMFGILIILSSQTEGLFTSSITLFFSFSASNCFLSSLFSSSIFSCFSFSIILLFILSTAISNIFTNSLNSSLLVSETSLIKEFLVSSIFE